MENNDLISRSELIQLFTDTFNKVETDEFGETRKAYMLNLQGITKVINECPASTQCAECTRRMFYQKGYEAGLRYRDSTAIYVTKDAENTNT